MDIFYLLNLYPASFQKAFEATYKEAYIYLYIYKIKWKVIKIGEIGKEQRGSKYSNPFKKSISSLCLCINIAQIFRAPKEKLEIIIEFALSEKRHCTHSLYK